MRREGEVTSSKRVMTSMVGGDEDVFFRYQMSWVPQGEAAPSNSLGTKRRTGRTTARRTSISCARQRAFSHMSTSLDGHSYRPDRTVGREWAL